MRTKEHKKMLNQKTYDGYMVHRYMDDLQRRYPRLLPAINIGIVAFMFVFSAIGFFATLAELAR